MQAGHQVTDHHNFRCLLSPTNPHKLLSNSTLSPSTKCHSTSIPERVSRRRSQGRQRPQRGRSLSATESAAVRRLSSLSRWVPSNAEIATFLRLSRSSSTFTTMLFYQKKKKKLRHGLVSRCNYTTPPAKPRSVTLPTPAPTSAGTKTVEALRCSGWKLGRRHRRGVQTIIIS